MASPRVGSALAAPSGLGSLITLDTSGILALAVLGDPNHARALDAFDGDPGPHVVPAAVLGEIVYMLEREGGVRASTTFVLDLRQGLYELDCEQADLERGARLTLRYESMGSGSWTGR